MPQARVEILDRQAALARIIACATFFVLIGAWCFFIPFVLLDWHDLGADVTILLLLFGLVVAGLPAISVVKGIGGQAREIANMTAELSGRGVCIPGELMIDARRIRKIRSIDQDREKNEYCRLCEFIRSRLSIGRGARGTGGGT